jgi:hypothetical protein
MLSEPLQKDIEFRGKQYDAWYYLNDNKTTEIFYGGAAGGGKSFLGCVWHVTNRARYPGSRGLIGRSDLGDLKQSTLITLFKVCQLMGYEIGVDFRYNDNKSVINWKNGSQTILADLFQYPADPDFISLGSTEYTDAFIDEGTEIKLKAFDIVNSRLRWMISDFGIIPKIFVTCNPGPGWIKDNYLVDPIRNEPIQLKPDQKFVRALVTDNPDKSFVQIYSQQLMKMHSEYDRQRLLFGDWNVKRGANNPFAYALNEQIHCDTNVYLDIKKPVFVSVDFNLEPFASLTANIYRDHLGLHVHFVGEVSVSPGSVPTFAEKLKTVHNPYLYSLRMTGDSLGKNRNITQVDNASNFEMIRRIMGLRQNQLTIPHDPLHETSRNDFNYLLHMANDPMNRVFVKINPDLCPNFINELRYTQCDEHGKIIKQNRTDETQRADFLDNGRYLVNAFLKTEIERHQKQNFGNIRVRS